MHAWCLIGRPALTSLDILLYKIQDLCQISALCPDFVLPRFHHRTRNLTSPRPRTQVIPHFCNSSWAESSAFSSKQRAVHPLPRNKFVHGGHKT